MQHLNNLVELYQWSCEQHADRKLLGTKKGGTWHWLTYRQFRNLVDDVRGGLASLGVQAGDRVAFIGDNSVEWASPRMPATGSGRPSSRCTRRSGRASGSSSWRTAAPGS